MTEIHELWAHDERSKRHDNDLPGPMLARVRAHWAKRIAELVERDHEAALIIDDARFPSTNKVRQIREARG